MPRCCPIHPSIGRIEEKRESQRDREGARLRPPVVPWRKQGRFQKASSSRDEQEPVPDMRDHALHHTQTQAESIAGWTDGGPRKRKDTLNYHR